MLSNDAASLCSMCTRVTIFSTGSKFRPVSNYMLLYSCCQFLCCLVINYSLLHFSILPSLSLSQVYRVPEVYIFQFNAPLYFANVGVFRSRLYIETGVNPSEFEERDVGCFQQCCTRVRGWGRGGGEESGMSREEGRREEKGGWTEGRRNYERELVRKGGENGGTMGGR